MPCTKSSFKHFMFHDNSYNNWDDNGNDYNQNYDEEPQYDSDTFDKEYISGDEFAAEEPYERATKRKLNLPPVDHMVFLGNKRPKEAPTVIPVLDPVTKWSHLFTGAKSNEPLGDLCKLVNSRQKTKKYRKRKSRLGKYSIKSKADFPSLS